MVDDLSGFFDADQPSVDLVELRGSSVGRIEASLPPGAVLRKIRGRKSRTEQQFFDEAAAALQFPDYFGENWDAFEECLRDMRDGRDADHVIVVTDASQLLADADPAKLAMLVDIVRVADQKWAQPSQMASPHRLRTLLAETDSRRMQLEQRAAAAGVGKPPGSGSAEVQ